VRLSVLPARAAYIVTVRQEGKDVVATGSGTIDLTGLTESTGASESPGISPSENFIATGQSNSSFAIYESLTGPAVSGVEALPVPIAAAEKVSASTKMAHLLRYLEWVLDYAYRDMRNATFASLGVTPGTDV
jgi:hypothetical protein